MTPSTDGRRRRAQRTREAIVDALLALIAGGEPAPTAAEVAAKAGVAERSIRQHFATREALFAAGVARHAAAGAAPPPAVDPSAPRARRVAAFAARRAAELEASAAVRRAILARPEGSPAVSAARAATLAARRAELARVFAAELGARRGAARARLLAALDAAASGGAWDHLRLDQGLSAGAAEAVLAETIAALIG